MATFSTPSSTPHGAETGPTSRTGAPADASRAPLAGGPQPGPEALLRLQRLAGNRVVQRWLDARRCVARASASQADTAARFHEVVPILAADVKRTGDTIRGMLPLGRLKSGKEEFSNRLEWLVDQLTWVTHAMVWALRLADEAQAGGPDSAKKFAEAGTHLTAAMFGARAVSILLVYDAFYYEVLNAFPAPTEWHLADGPRDGALNAHRYLDPILANLSTRSPVRVEAAVDELLDYDWGWAFGQLRDTTQEEIEAHHRVVGWINIAALAWTAFDLWLAGKAIPGGRIKPPGGVGGGAAVATVLTSAQSVEALRRLVALGLLNAPKLVKHLGGGTVGGQTPKPIETSTKGGTGGEPPKPSGEKPVAEAEGTAKAEPSSPPPAPETGPLEGEKSFDVYRRNGQKITDIDSIEGNVLWEEKSAVNAGDVKAWIRDEITRKVELYLEARQRLPPFYRNAKIGFRFSRVPKEAFWDRVIAEIERLQAQHPDIILDPEVVY
jgi:hypothetical protein